MWLNRPYNSAFFWSTYSAALLNRIAVIPKVVVAYFFVCPRAKMLATKLSTSVEQTSQ